MQAMKQHHAAKQAKNDFDILTEASLRMSPAMQRYYHDRIAQLAKEKLNL